MEAVAGTASSSLLPAHHRPSRLASKSLALRPRPCGLLRAAAPGTGGGKEDVQAGVAGNGSPVIKVTIAVILAPLSLSRDAEQRKRGRFCWVLKWLM
jgi:hypothetical protein